MELFNNKNNDTLKFKLNIEGIDINNIEPRLLLLTKENKNYVFIGKINENICSFNIPELETYEKGINGKAKFEIISEDNYFPVWEDNFEIKTKASVKFEQVINEIEKPIKPKISAIFETQEKDEEKIQKDNKKVELDKDNKEFENKPEQENKEDDDKQIEKKKNVRKIKNEDIKKESVKTFNSFFNI